MDFRFDPNVFSGSELFFFSFYALIYLFSFQGPRLVDLCPRLFFDNTDYGVRATLNTCASQEAICKEATCLCQKATTEIHVYYSKPVEKKNKVFIPEKYLALKSEISQTMWERNNTFSPIVLLLCHQLTCWVLEIQTFSSDISGQKE